MLDLLFSNFAKNAKAGSTVNMFDLIVALAFDVVGELAYGEPMGHLEKEEDVMNLRKIIFDGFFIMGNLGHVRGQMFWVDNPLSRALGPLFNKK
jgi:hypothetical protein